MKNPKKPTRRERQAKHHEREIVPVKEAWKAGTMLNPVPVILVTCVGKDDRPNIITLAWTGTVCSEPPMLSISVRKERHSYGLIEESGEFVVNLPSVRQISATDYCGVVSGRDVDKFAKTGLTAGEACTVRAPIIMECPINIECAVRQKVELGSHVMFLAEITMVQVSKQLVKPSGRLAIEDAQLAAFAHGGYYALGKKLGFFGFSVQKNTKRGE